MGKPPDGSVSNEYVSRHGRTVRVTMDLGGRPYGRGDFVRHVADTTGLPALEAVGPTQQSHVWELTFSSLLHVTQFLAAGDFCIRGHAAKVSGADSSTVKVRLHWIPYYVGNDLFITMFERHGMKVVADEYEKSKVQGLEHVRTGVRCFTLITDKVADIPHIVPFRHGDRDLEALITMTGRMPRCLRCHLSGHVRNQCTTPFCYRCRSFGHKKSDGVCSGRSYSNAAASGSRLPEGVEPEEVEETVDTEKASDAIQVADANQLPEDNLPVSSPLVNNGSAPLLPIDVDEPSDAMWESLNDADLKESPAEVSAEVMEDSSSVFVVPSSEDSVFAIPSAPPASSRVEPSLTDASLVALGKRRIVSTASLSSVDEEVSDVTSGDSVPSALLSSNVTRSGKPDAKRSTKPTRNVSVTSKSDKLDASYFVRAPTCPTTVTSNSRTKKHLNERNVR
jgi:hypothetical protein